MPLIGRKKVSEAIDRLVKSKNDLLRVEYIRTFSDVITGTPVDKGRARGNWFLSTGSPSKKLINPKKWTKRPDENLSKMSKTVLGKKTFFTNNLPYIETLEYGDYPNPVKRGTFVKGKGFVKKSAGGFSKKAPAGWVRIALLRMKQRIKKL